MNVQDSSGEGSLRERILEYVRAHHTMTIATAGSSAGAEAESKLSRDAAEIPHAATVFYAVDDALRLVFLSKPSSLHGSHIGGVAPVAVTISAEYEDWELIQGVQLWGEARRLSGKAKAGAMALYVKRFPFVKEMMRRPGLAKTIHGIGVYRVEPRSVAFTDNTTGVFGRGVLVLEGKSSSHRPAPTS
jgi:uncharacterized protein